MTIDIQVHNQRKNPDVDEFAASRMERVARLFASRLQGLRCNIVLQNQASRHPTKTCSIDATIKGHGVLHVHADAANPYEAVSKAAEKLIATLQRRFARQKSRRLHDENPNDDGIMWA